MANVSHILVGTLAGGVCGWRIAQVYESQKPWHNIVVGETVGATLATIALLFGPYEAFGGGLTAAVILFSTEENLATCTQPHITSKIACSILAGMVGVRSLQLLYQNDR